MTLHAPTAREYFLSDVSPVIRVLIIGDVMYYAGVGLFGPIFALFIAQTVAGNSIEVVGIAMAIYLITKSLTQIPAAWIIDKICGEQDDFWFMFAGLLAASLIPFLYLAVRTPLDLYLVQFLLGIALAFNFPSFMALFTKHIADRREATIWGVYYTLYDLVTAGAAALGGILAAFFGFETVIIIGSSVGILGALALLPARKHIRVAQNC